MPEPLLYLQAMAAAAGASALVAIVLSWWSSSVKLPLVLAIVVGAIAGYWWLRYQPRYPPVSALDRFLVIVLPAVTLIEALACWKRLPSRVATALRLALALVVGRILLHDSVYLIGTNPTWTTTEAIGVLVLCAVMLAGTWLWLGRLAARSTGISLSLALVLSLLCAGIPIALAGSIKVGGAAVPLAAALAGAALVMRPYKNHEALVGIGVVSLFSVLFIGRFFGGLSTVSALTIFLAPLLCWASELPYVRARSPAFRGGLRIVLVAVPLIVVLVLAKQAFDRDFKPLLTSLQIAPRSE
jgi:hypothetical protein